MFVARNKPQKGCEELSEIQRISRGSVTAVHEPFPFDRSEFLGTERHTDGESRLREVRCVPVPLRLAVLVG